MRIRRSSRQGCVVLTLVGRLDLAAAPKVQRAILKQLAEQPPAIICDLAQVEGIDPLCAGVFTSIRHPALGWPGTALVLCGTRPAVAEVLVQLGVAGHLRMYPSLDEALANARARPERLRARLTLGPVLTAAAAGRQFVAEVCGHWGLQGLAEPAALVASELVTNSVVHARTALELRVELRGSRLQVAVHDQDPDLAGLLAAKEGTDRGLGLKIVDQVAKVWGVRQDGAGGKTVWCILDPPPRQADPVGRSRESPASTGTAGEAAGVDAADHHPPDAMTRPGSVLVLTKLRPPAPRAGLIPRAGLQALLQSGLEAKLCLVDAPAGFGKTTLLAQWGQAAEGRRVAWVSLDEGDNDPTRFWEYVVAAFGTVEPAVGATALTALHGRSVDIPRVVLPSLLSDLRKVGTPLVLVLDDYHRVTNASCHHTLGFFLDHLPAGIHVVLSTRADPPLSLATMRARGELAEVRVAELQFTSQEAAALLNGAMGLQLATEEVARLAERTEGWAAGLVLAGLSLQGREDPNGFIASFQGDDRHVADYLTAEVLDRQPQESRTFLMRTSVLERLSGPLCDALLETDGSAEVLAELERSNLFLVPLDDRREWYRYQQLFGELLRLDLVQRDPELVPVLHRRAAAWHRQAGNVDEAIYHASVAEEFAEVGELIATHWLAYWRSGRRATVARWLDGLPEEAIRATPPVAYVAAWIGGFGGASKQETERWLVATEDASYRGPPPDGISSLAFGAALARAVMVFDDVGRSTTAARRALELAGPQPSSFHWTAQAALGLGLYLSGRSAEARMRLEKLVSRVPSSAQPYAVLIALAVLAMIVGDEDDRAAVSLARRAATVVDAQGLSVEPLSGIVHLALGRALAHQGELAEAEVQLERALELLGVDSMLVYRAFALLALALVRHRRGELPGARALVERARELVEQAMDPGVLPALLERTEEGLGSRPRRAHGSGPLTERELAVLRMLPTQLSTREIGRELSVSVTTIRSHVQAIYRKLDVTSRTEAVVHARQLHLLPQAGDYPVPTVAAHQTPISRRA
jgi:LuxR family transcriptional regulator, maltose regulon positive regulatory protein